MAEEMVHKQEFAIRNLSTQNVTLYPTKAQIIRDINDITLKPGANEVTIYGLTPTADESSIKVDGKGSATITDMMVDLIPNRENYEDVYPEDSDAEEIDEPDDDSDSSEHESDIIRALTEEKKENDDSLKKASEQRASASSQLAMLENYARSLDKDRPNDLGSCISAYSDEREKVYAVHFASETKIKALEKERIKISKKEAKALRVTKKEKEKAKKDKAKKLEKKRRSVQDKLDAKKRLKEERIQFWPRKVYRIVLSLDTNSDMTPGSSRRGSIDSMAKPISEENASSCQISFSVSYITYSAWWSPRYDLSLNSTSNSGLILYRAEFCNTTSEMWKDAKVVLSTSQTSFQGLSEPLPSMQPWHIRLQKMFGPGADAVSGALYSASENQYKVRTQAALSGKGNESRNALFGLGNSTVSGSLFGGQKSHHEQPQMQQQQHMQQPQVQQTSQQPAQGSSLFGGFGSNVHNQPIQANVNSGGLFGSRSANPFNGSTAAAFAAPSQPLAEGNPASDDEEKTIYDTGAITIPELPELSFQESEWSETGLTATYDIPGVRTITPSHTTRRHKIASISLKNVRLSYLLVPKLRTAAFLKARIHNTSTITLLKGPVGLTLDGSFLGNASLSRCSAGETLNLSLGVDPSLNVVYSKPVVKRSQTGVFQKEGSGIYTRSITITNTKSNRTLEGQVLDQIPVSEDERLKVDILQPSGLRSEGDTARSGVGIPAVGKVTEKWGTARAVLKKAGEVCWDINIEPSRSVRLVLEYEARFPSTDMVVGCRD